jgi:hypothetical protein
MEESTSSHTTAPHDVDGCRWWASFGPISSVKKKSFFRMLRTSSGVLAQDKSREILTAVGIVSFYSCNIIITANFVPSFKNALN